MNVDFRNKISQLGRKGKVAEGKVLKSAGNKLAEGIASNINRSNANGADYTHLADSIKTSNVKTNKFGERSVQVGATKDKAFILKFLELGTSKMNPQLPLTKGVANSKDEVSQILNAGMKGIMKL